LCSIPIEPVLVKRLNQELGKHVTTERIEKRISQMSAAIASRVKELSDESQRVGIK